jgi:hypothetical protein
MFTPEKLTRFPVAWTSPHAPDCVPVAVQASRHEVALAEHEIHMPLPIRECQPEVLGDHRPYSWPWWWVAWPHVMPDVLIRDDLVREGHMPRAQTSS